MEYTTNATTALFSEPTIPSSIILVVRNGERKFDEVYIDSDQYGLQTFTVSGARRGIAAGFHKTLIVRRSSQQESLCNGSSLTFYFVFEVRRRTVFGEPV